MFRYVLISLLLFFGHNAFGQEGLSGHVRFERFGMEFDLPKGWIGEVGEELIVVSNEDSPFNKIILSLNTNSVAELEAATKEPLTDNDGTYLLLTSELTHPDANSIAGYYKGMVEWQSCEGYVIGASNPGGYGLSILSLAFGGEPIEVMRALGEELFSTLNFFPVKTTSSAKPKEEKEVSGNSKYVKMFQNVRLTYMHSYSSGGGGTSSENIIELCSAGYFHYSDKNTISTGTAGSSVYGDSKDKGQGTWKVLKEGGKDVLKLFFSDGSTMTMILSMEGDKLFLDGYRYFKTYAGEDMTPNCH